MPDHWADWVPPGERDPQVTLLFGSKTFDATTTCADIHYGPIPDGSRCMCSVCHGCSAGLEAMLQRRKARADAKAESTKAASEIEKRALKQRRRK